MIVRVERMAARADALTAARASAMPIFRELLPGEVLAPGQLVSLTNASFLRTDVEGADGIYARIGDAQGFELVMRQVRAISDVVSKHGGAVVKTIGAGVLATFDSPLGAARAAIEAHRIEVAPLVLRTAAHQGPAMAATLNDRLDYFGQTLASLDALLAQTDPGTTTLSEALCDDHQVSAIVGSRPARSIAVPGREQRVWGLNLRPAGSSGRG
jgi:eukaryotic-like serine/threonine-protein kinase